LRHKAIPQVEGKVFVNAAEASDEVILESSDGAFSRVAAMSIGRHELVVDVFVFEELFEHRRAFVVEALELWAEASLAEFGVQSFVGV
jgi:hypothetical protein